MWILEAGLAISEAVLCVAPHSSRRGRELISTPEAFQPECKLPPSSSLLQNMG